MAEIAITKKCSTCKIELSLSAFHMDNKRSDRRKRSCKSCDKEYSQKYYVKNKERLKRSAETWNRENREKARLSIQKWHKAHPEYARIMTAEQRDNLSDTYLTMLISRESGLARDAVRSVRGLINLKRVQIQLLRVSK